MMRCRSPHWLAAAGLLLAVPLAHATTVIAPTFDRLVNAADYIVRATVKSVTSEWRPDPGNPGERFPATLVTLEVHEVIKGSPPSPLVLELVGGRIGDYQLTVDGAPKFAVGQESVLFVRGNGRQIVPLVGMRHGQFPVRRDARTGIDQVMQSNGRLLYEADVARLNQPDATPRNLVRAPGDRPLSSAEFSARIRANIRPEEDTREVRN